MARSMSSWVISAISGCARGVGHGRGVVGPGAGVAVGLQFEPDAAAGRAGLARGHLLVGAQQVLHVVAVLVGEHVGVDEGAALGAELRLQLVEEAQVDVDELVARAVEGPRAAGRRAAAGLHLSRRRRPCRSRCTGRRASAPSSPGWSRSRRRPRTPRSRWRRRRPGTAGSSWLLSACSPCPSPASPPNAAARAAAARRRAAWMRTTTIRPTSPSPPPPTAMPRPPPMPRRPDRRDGPGRSRNLRSRSPPSRYLILGRPPGRVRTS